MKPHVLGGEVKERKMENGTVNSSLSSIKAIDSLIFDAFFRLTSDEESERLTAGLQLLQHMAKSENTDKRTKEIEYVAKRLIRGVGASTTASRAGFFTTLVAFLETISPQELTVEMVLDIASKQLNVGETIHNKEDSDAVVGQILICGALIRSKKVYSYSDKGIARLCGILIRMSKHRMYHNAMAWTFVVHLLNELPVEKFSKYVWPVLSNELTKNWEHHTVYTIHCLIVAIRNFPSSFPTKYMESTFGGHSLLNAHSANRLFKLFFGSTSSSLVAHPSYECFGSYIAGSNYLETFWETEVDEALKSPTKLREIQTLKMFTDILGSSDCERVQVSKLLTSNFMTMLTDSLKRVKFKKEDALKDLYDAFFEALFKWSGKVQNDEEKVNVITKLIFHPGLVNLEKFTSQRVIHQIISNLGTKGVKQTFNHYKNIFLGKVQKNPNDSAADWLNAERQCAGYMLQHIVNHKNVQASLEWRRDQLKFFMVSGLFHTKDGENIVGKKEDDGVISNDLAAQMRNIFYSSLQSKLPKLSDERDTLLPLVETCNEVLCKKNSNKFLRSAVDDQIAKAWSEMYREISKDWGTSDNLKLVFQILLLHMGLQLFREPEMAENAIADLEKCIEKLNQQKKGEQKKAIPTEGKESDELEWIEVVVDLFLHFLSHNTSSLRNVVNTVFPHLCENLSLTAVHQILSVLDMQDGKNPLSDRNESEVDDNTSVDMQSSEESDDEECDEDEENDDDDGEEEEDEDDDELVEEEEEGTHTDALRNALSTALMGDRDDDQNSIDLNDMDEEDGKRLDEVLSGIFKTMMKPKQYKKTKGYRVETTTVMHFRIRVLDLIELYIQHNPNLLIVVEMMVTLFNMIEFCTEAELRPLANKVEKVLGKLTATRIFASVADLSEKNISDYLRIVIEKKVTAQALEMVNKMKAKCCVFLIACTKLLRNTNEAQEASADVLHLLEEYIDDFIKSRNPTVTASLFSDIFKSRWSGSLVLAKKLAEKGLMGSTRTFRRIQIAELMDTLYRNQQLIRQEAKLSKKCLKSVEKQIGALVETLASQKNVSLREFNNILNVLCSANRCHTKIPMKSHLDTPALCEHIQSIRKTIKLENIQCYARFCACFGVNAIRKNLVISNDKSQESTINGHITLDQNGDTNIDENDGETKADKQKKYSKEIESEKHLSTGVVKRKLPWNSAIDNRKEKRLRKEERMRVLSKGMDVTSSEDDVGGSEESVSIDDGEK